MPYETGLQETVSFRKKDGKILVGDLEVLHFVNDEAQGGQGLVGFATNRASGGRIETIKLYGLHSRKDSEDTVTFSRPNNSYWETIRQHEIAALGKIGSSEFPRFPVLLTAGDENGVLYITMTCGRDSKISAVEEGGVKLTIDDYAEGRLITLDDIICCSSRPGAPSLMAEQAYDGGWKRKLGYFVEMAKSIRTMHSTYAIAHNDIKPSQFLFLFGKESPEPVIQTLDLGMHVQLESLGSMAVFTSGITTLMYNSPEMLATALNPERAKALSPQDFIMRDIWSLGVVGQELVLGRHPYSEPAMLLMQQDSGISSLKDEIANFPHPQLFDGLLKRQIACVQEAQHRYLDGKRTGRLIVLERGVPSRVVEYLHSMTGSHGLQDCENGNLGRVEAGR